jgi:hypothetical protein
MAQGSNHAGLTDQDYEAILGAVMETSRGRWFLHRYAAANRQADTKTLLDAIGQLEAVVREQRTIAAPAPPASAVPAKADMGQRLARLRRDIAETLTAAEGRPTADREVLDAVGDSLNRANADILSAAEQIQEIAWTLRETGVDAPHCETLDRLAVEIYGASRIFDVTATRARMLVQALRAVEGQITDEGFAAQGPAQAGPGPSTPPAFMIGSPDAAMPQRSGLIAAEDIMVVQDAQAAPRAGYEGDPQGALSNFASLDTLSLAEKYSRFT